MSATERKFYFLTAGELERYRNQGVGHWVCVKCDTPAETERKNPKCRRCTYGDNCGRDCALSRVFCHTCGASEDK